MTPEEWRHFLNCQEATQNHNYYLRQAAAQDQTRFNQQVEAEKRRVNQLNADERWREITLSMNNGNR
jgi:hypothetical protein